MKQLRNYFFLLLCFITLQKADAYIACFTPSSVKLCVGSQIKLTDCSGDPNPLYIYDVVNNPSQITNLSTHIYTVPGNYRIVQIVTNGGGTNASVPLDIIVVASPDPAFTISSCIGRNVSLNITDVLYDRFAINYGDGSLEDTVAAGPTTPHVYSADGSYSIKVTGLFNPKMACGSKTVSVYSYFSLIKPDLVDLRVLSQSSTAGSIRLRFNSSDKLIYSIEQRIGNGIYSGIHTLTGDGTEITFEDINLNTQANVYGYRIVAVDNCGNRSVSDEISSMILSVQDLNMVNQVDWTDYTLYSSTFANYNLNRNNVDILTGVSVNTYGDNAIVCQKKYCYHTLANLTTSGSSGTHVSYSIDSCVLGRSTVSPPPVANVDVSISGNTALLTWTDPGNAQTYHIYRSVNGGAYANIGNPATAGFSDNLSDLQSTYCYQIAFTDVCNNSSQVTLPVCPVILQAVQTGNSVTLNWNSYSGFDNTGIASYEVQRLDENGTVLSFVNVGTSFTFNETVNLSSSFVRYRIRVIPSNAAFTAVYSNDVLFRFEAKVYAPDIFTPNADGNNDVFLLKGKYFTTFSLTIFNRWGEIVFNSNSINDGWDGNYKGQYAQADAYTYKVIVTDNNNKELIQTGTVTLIR